MRTAARARAALEAARRGEDWTKIGSLMRGLRWAGLEVADRSSPLLPRGAAYALADLAGRPLVPPRSRAPSRSWRRTSLRVCAATGPPDARPRVRRDWCARAFVQPRALLRSSCSAPRTTRSSGSPSIVERRRLGALAAAAAAAVPRSRSAATSATSSRSARSSPRTACGAVAPVEEIEPARAFDFVSARGGASGRVELVPALPGRAAPIVKRCGARRRSGRRSSPTATSPAMAHPVTMFGHADDALPPARPRWPLTHRAHPHGRPLPAHRAGALHRRGRDCSRLPNSGDRRADDAARSTERDGRDASRRRSARRRSSGGAPSSRSGRISAPAS